jgi:hypothetical protein
LKQIPIQKLLKTSKVLQANFKTKTLEKLRLKMSIESFLSFIFLQYFDLRKTASQISPKISFFSFSLPQPSLVRTFSYAKYIEIKR